MFAQIHQNYKTRPCRFIGIFFLDTRKIIGKLTYFLLNVEFWKRNSETSSTFSFSTLEGNANNKMILGKLKFVKTINPAKNCISQNLLKINTWRENCWIRYCYCGNWDDSDDVAWCILSRHYNLKHLQKQTANSNIQFIIQSFHYYVCVRLFNNLNYCGFTLL